MNTKDGGARVLFFTETRLVISERMEAQSCARGF
jgi:hypothetical protein